jgi:predicted DsbA family dithiol-disulfide isomerase
VRAAHRFAMASEFITGEMVEVSEFPQLAVKYGVSGVPQTVINETVHVIGAVPESEFARKILEAIGK